MKLLEHKNETHQEIFKMELEADELEGMLDSAYKQLVKEVAIDGFRKGKAPRDVLERHVGSEALFDHAMKEYVPSVMDEMMVENKIKAYANPSVNLISREPVVFETIVPLPPDITLGDYNSIKMKPNPVEVTGNEVEDILKHAQKEDATLFSTGEPAAMEDIVVMDIESDVEGEPYIVAKGDTFQLRPNFRYPAPGFSEELEGLKTGDEKEFTLAWPDTFHDKAIAGKNICFHVKITDVQREKLPELNDDFARRLDPDSAGIDIVRQNVHDNLMARAEGKEREAFETKVIDALVEKSQIAFPPILVEDEINHMVNEYIERIRNYTRSEEECKAVLKDTLNDELRESYRSQAEQRVKRNLVVSKFVEVDKVEVAEADVDKQIAAITAGYADQADTPQGLKDLQEKTTYLNKPESREKLRRWLIAIKARQVLADKAKAD
ncbi:MAG: trigger factor [Dehalococcoidia bacterium]|nr:trigger factor [Dehalococcoidia bacterium]